MDGWEAPVHETLGTCNPLKGPNKTKGKGLRGRMGPRGGENLVLVNF